MGSFGNEIFNMLNDKDTYFLQNKKFYVYELNQI